MTTQIDAPMLWAVWPLSPDSDAQERYIITTEDGSVEVTGIINKRDDADLIVRTHNNLVKALKMVKSELDEGRAIGHGTPSYWIVCEALEKAGAAVEGGE